MTERADPPSLRRHRRASETLVEVLLANPLATVRMIAAVTGVPRATVQDHRRELIAVGRLPKLSRREVGLLRNRTRRAARRPRTPMGRLLRHRHPAVL